MNANPDPQHPYIRLLKAIDEQKVVVIDNIPAPPAIGDAYIASNLLIIVCHRGAIINDDVPEYRLRAHDVSVLMPDQIVLPTRVTDDLCCTNVAISCSSMSCCCNTPTPVMATSSAAARPVC